MRAKPPLREPVIYVGPYGTNEVGSCARDDGTWIRVDTYRPHDVSPKEPWNREVRERRFVAGPGDISDRHSMHHGDGGYDSACSLCYLGFSHTRDAHAARTGGKS